MRSTPGLALTTAAVVASLTVLPGLPGLPATAHAADTCFGLTPTIVGAPGQRLVRGTEGDDVIVAAGVTHVRARGGDDTICARGPAWIEAGDGDDRVRTHHRRGRTLVVLGSGSDRFEGSAGRDRVFAENFDGEDAYPGSGDANADVVRTRGGDDRVESGAYQQQDDDRIALGPGDDALKVFTSLRGDAHLAGGPGSDRLVTWAPTDSTAPLSYDLVTGTATADEVRFATVQSFADLSLSSVAASVAEVRGTDGPNEIYVAGERTSVAAGGGPDTVWLFGDPVSMLGAPGRDVVEMLGYSDFEDLPVVFDLGGRTFRRGEVIAPFATEELHVGTTGRTREAVSVLGTSGPDVVVTRACGSEVRGAGGADRLESRSEQCEGVPTTLRGDGGDDVLRGGYERDVLLGGAGHDRAFGNGGLDRCRAEVERSCERG